jgi:hypothetical protein
MTTTELEVVMDPLPPITTAQNPPNPMDRRREGMRHPPGLNTPPLLALPGDEAATATANSRPGTGNSKLFSIVKDEIKK